MAEPERGVLVVGVALGVAGALNAAAAAAVVGDTWELQIFWRGPGVKEQPSVLLSKACLPQRAGKI